MLRRYAPAGPARPGRRVSAGAIASARRRLALLGAALAGLVAAASPRAAVPAEAPRSASGLADLGAKPPQATDVPWAEPSVAVSTPAAPGAAAPASDGGRPGSAPADGATARGAPGAPGAVGGAAGATEAAVLERAGAVFQRRCISCHTVGDGERIGPDLVGVDKRRNAGWIRRYLLDTDAMIDGGDAVAVELVAKYRGIRMPTQGLTPDEADSLIVLLATCTARGGCRGPFGKLTARDATPQDVLAGAALFVGATALARGGPPCLGCHATRGENGVRGGSLGPDLTFAYARLGEGGLEAALGTKLPAVMRDVYGARPIDPQESLRVRGLLFQQARNLAPPEPRYDFVYLGVLGAVAALFGLAGLRARPRRGETFR